MAEWPYYDCPKKDESGHVCVAACLPADYSERWAAIKERDYEILPVQYDPLVGTSEDAILAGFKRCVTAKNPWLRLIRGR